MNFSPISPARLAQAKAAYTTRHVELNGMTTLMTGNLIPHSGDLVLARIEEIGQHRFIELKTGRKANLFPGDEIIVCYGHRYAPDQFEAEIPLDLSPCHLVAAGGLAAQVLSQHNKMSVATTLTPIGLLGDRNRNRINLLDWGLQPIPIKTSRPLTIAVVGSSMNSGKTTTAANLIKGLVQSGLTVGAAKITGTGAGNDVWLMQDAGAYPVFDFTDAGFPSTYLTADRDIQQILTTLTSHLAAAGVEAIVLEIADGLFQEETAKLVASQAFRHAVDGVLFAANGALGAAAGVETLQRYHLPVLAVSGVVTTSPLAARETAAATGLQVLNMEMLRNQAVELTSALRHPQVALSA
jgi:molybdopterin-guanine dinucleotide biosynthesis protein